MALAFIANPTTPAGKELLQLVTEAEIDLSQCIWGSCLEDFNSSRLSEVTVLVLSQASGGTPEVIGRLWPQLKALRWIHCLSAGVDSLLPVLKSLGPEAMAVQVTNTKGAFSRSLAEYAVAVMMHFNKQITRLQANRVSRTWEKFVMNEVHGMTCGFIGFSDIGQHTARLCRALGMRVLAWRNRKGPGNELADLVSYASDPRAKVEIFEKSDFVICSLPGGESTYHACGAGDFAVMKPTAVFISLGRGSCVDEAALVEVLKNKKILGAALDVFEKEPLSQESPLWDMENVLLSAHNVHIAPTYRKKTVDIFVQKLKEFQSADFGGFREQVDKSSGSVKVVWLHFKASQVCWTSHCRFLQISKSISEVFSLGALKRFCSLPNVVSIA